MQLTWEDAYFDNAKSSVAVHNGFLDGKPGIISFGSEMDAQRGNYLECPIEVAVSNMSCHTYLLGEGIVGKVALRKKHQWIFAGEYNSKLLPECHEECQLQFAVGIKTILLAPVVPLGVVQLGSLHTVMEDLTVVASIKDLFSILQHIGTCISLAPSLDRLNPYTPITMPPMGNFSESSALSDLLDPIHSPLSVKEDSTALDFVQLRKNELSTISSQFQVDLPLSQDVLDQVLGMDASPCIDESTLKAMCSELLVDPTEKLCMLNQSIYTDHKIVGDISKPSFENELNVFSVMNKRFIPTQPTMPNSYMDGEEHYDLCFVKDKKGQKFRRELAEESKSLIRGRCLNFPFHSELHKALGFGYLGEHDEHTWNAIISKTDELSNSICHSEVPEVYGPLVEKTSKWFIETSDTEHLLDAMIADIHSASDDGVSDISRCIGSCGNSSENFCDSCVTQSRTDGDVFELEDSVPCRDKYTASFPKKKGFISSPTGSSSKSIVSLLINEEQQINDMADGHDKRDQKSSQSSKKRGRSSDFHRPRPRDRQLIQDRLKELRDLIPNGSKCSIDVLLDRTVKHMLFLRSIPCRAEKLRHSTYPKVKVDGCNLPGAYQNGASWAYEVGGQPQVCPLIVENLDQPGQMLVEMLCKEYGLFLEIAQVIKCLKLTILKGVLESRSDKLWAHFIIETSRGFHRMDILLPLMQLLQRN